MYLLSFDHVRPGGPSAIEVVGAPLRVVDRRVPAIAGASTIVAPLKQWCDLVALSCNRGFFGRLFDFRIVCSSLKDTADPFVKGFLAW